MVRKTLSWFITRERKRETEKVGEEEKRNGKKEKEGKKESREGGR